MEWTAILALAGVMFAGAALYSSVGHAGASAYLAAMALFGVAPATMRPVALVLNIAVAILATFRYARAGLFSWSLFWPLALASVPMAFVGGALHLPVTIYRPLVGLVLLAAALRLLWSGTGEQAVAGPLRPPTLLQKMPAGAGIGLLSGLTGTGGGIFLSPLAIFLRWSTPREVSGVSAAFILVNSIAGLAGNVASVGALPRETGIYLAAVIVGGLIGTHLGVSRLPTPALFRALAAVLVIAALKLILT